MAPPEPPPPWESGDGQVPSPEVHQDGEERNLGVVVDSPGQWPLGG